MRILLASSNSGSRGGGELFLLSLASALSACGHEIILWASQHSRMDELCARFSEFGTVQRSPYPNTYDRRFRLVSAVLDSAVSRRIATEWCSLGPEVIHLNKQNLEDGLDLVDALARTNLPGRLYHPRHAKRRLFESSVRSPSRSSLLVDAAQGKGSAGSSRQVAGRGSSQIPSEAD